MTTGISDACFFIKYDDDTFEINFRDVEPPNWDAFRQKSMLKTVKVRCMKQVDTTHIMVQLALAIKSHPSITAIHFGDCWIKDLGHLCIANSERHQLVEFEFNCCTFTLCAVETLHFMLKTYPIETLRLIYCTFNEETTTAMQFALQESRSLKFIECYGDNVSQPPSKLVNCIGTLASNSQTLESLWLTVTDDFYFGNISQKHPAGVLSDL